MKRIFISDLHLDDQRDDLTRAFESFLAKHCQDIDELYILGDFFEVWLGDDNQSEFNQRIASALSCLSCRVFLMHGNRDFLIGEDYCGRANATLLEDPKTIDLEGRPALLMHGDSLCTLDVEYMKARQLLRSPAFQADFLQKPLEERAAIAKQIRGESKAHTRETADDIMDVTPEEVTKAMQEAGVSLFIHGHTHRPAIHDVSLGESSGKRYVLGDWHTSMQYLMADGSDVELKEYQF
ncbi:MAG: UDP-2,3-diacylglucosamine diphosphatase [Pseudomonadales bacterium]|nr:UDP-2,3-diacylglucosamine diphosphatase [Pseudomonadales bacterium]MBO6566575.1 UDP-2,3-diacylglucosamine diphosphatase [Pseudomonadales bacterium]MBO6595049.1 UDP-2,3-diacylglucosamine diphosphatase [Pseudomonadales bacterium]MBO6657988.1 UDP-2,3-diacylglucosamine diphosphatase [Pseudomonadales bacterium]MBO6701554.1 UDP-2,3-diacylglucosamine diphosphatase [Pseudomonadales bacterium]